MQKIINPFKCRYIVIGDNDPSHIKILNNTEIGIFFQVFF